MNIKEKEIEEQPIPVLKLLEGGKDDNWLMTLSEGTVFVAKEKFVPGPSTGQIDRNDNLTEYALIFKGKKVAKLHVRLGPNEMEIWKDALIFSRNNNLIEILLVPTEKGLWVK